MENAYTRSPGEALKHFQVSEQNGLSEQQVLSQRKKYGKNGKFSRNSMVYRLIGC